MGFNYFRPSLIVNNSLFRHMIGVCECLLKFLQISNLLDLNEEN